MEWRLAVQPKRIPRKRKRSAAEAELDLAKAEGYLLKCKVAEETAVSYAAFCRDLHGLLVRLSDAMAYWNGRMTMTPMTPMTAMQQRRMTMMSMTPMTPMTDNEDDDDDVTALPTRYNNDNHGDFARDIHATVGATGPRHLNKQ